MRLRFAALTHPGRRYTTNQDAILLAGEVHQEAWRGGGVLTDDALPLLAVADGVSTSPVPSVASRALLEGLRDTFARQPTGSVRRLADEAFDRLCAASRRERGGRRGMASTLVAAFVRDERAVVFNAGDSRAYLIEAGQARRVSRDHTALQRMLDAGEVTPAEAVNAASFYSGLDAAFIADPLAGPPEVFARRVDLAPGARLLLCSDGLTGYVSDEELGAVSGTLEEIAGALFSTAMERGGEDNLSLVVVAREAGG